MLLVSGDRLVCCRLRLVLFACSFLLFLPVYAADIYRWVDENGQTQFSDVVPEKYKKSAKRMESQQSEPSVEQRREAEALAAKEKAQAAAQSKARTDAEKATSAASASTRGSPRPAADEGTDCATLHRRYRESLDCFAPYVTTKGATKAEAFAKCTTVADPSAKCGPAK